MIWSELAALADRTSQSRRVRSVGFRALQAHWNLPDDDATVDLVQTTLAAHGWTLRDDRVPRAPEERGAGIRPLVHDPLYRIPESNILAQRLRRPLDETTIADWLWLIPEETLKWTETADFTHDDALQEGYLGLHQAWHAPSTHRDRPASTWIDRARADIRRAIHRGYLKHSRTIHIPRHLQELLKEIETAHYTVAAAVGHEPTLQELATYLFQPIEKLRDALQYRKDPVSLDGALFDEEGEDSPTLQDRIPDPHDTVDQIVLHAERSDAIDPAMIPYLQVLARRAWSIDRLADWTGWSPSAIATALDRNGPDPDVPSDAIAYHSYDFADVSA